MTVLAIYENIHGWNPYAQPVTASATFDFDFAAWDANIWPSVVPTNCIILAVYDIVYTDASDPQYSISCQVNVSYSRVSGGNPVKNYDNVIGTFSTGDNAFASILGTTSGANFRLRVTTGAGGGGDCTVALTLRLVQVTL